ncbi:LysR family transcriptional regulator [Paracoccus sp. Z118]|uniref:LysR family transcriptional regulator n=1 Tax=Paracoccus sp. Z118 TaxID=2851017 RepID=UPI001C2B9583|nr:LysR family transcriptional regulator [Paracoccus sp. Z118]MBV0893586.1 LysR family transcriptional regulator [Paracoccus sp. Z118]
MDARIDNWDDLRLFLAVARAGTLSGAAREIGVNHSTVFRRIGAFEETLGVRLFDRLPNGYALTAAGEAMQESALRVEEEIAALDRKVTGQDLRLSGIVRITTVDMLAQGLLPRHLLAFRRAYPGIEIELTVGNATLNLTRREADVALRVGNQPPETLVGRRVGRLAFAVYGAAAAEATAPLAEQPWIGFDAEHAPLVRAFAEFLPGVRPAFRVNSVAAAIAAARAGIGLATLPCGVADLEPDLTRVAPLPESFTLDLWLLTHEDLRRTARIRAFLDFMAEALAREAPLLEGADP